MTSIFLKVAFLVVGASCVSACSESSQSPEKKRLLELAAARDAEEAAERTKQLALCQTQAVAEFKVHMAAKRHSDAATALRVCASALPDENLKTMFADAESRALVDDIEKPNASTFDRARAIETLMQHYPEVGRKYESRGVDLRMELHDERRRNADAVRANQTPSVGMAADDLRASGWGSPSSVNRTTTSYGTREQWVYGGGRYVYVERGRVVAVQD